MIPEVEVPVVTTEPEVDQQPPVITSVNIVVFDENSTDVVLRVNAVDINTVTYIIENGLDANLFTINPVSGEISFINPPDYETALDLGTDNEYNLNVTVTDTLGNFTTQAISININNLNDNVPVTIDNNGETAIEGGGIINGNLAAFVSDADDTINIKTELTFILDKDVSIGTLVLNSDGTYSYDIGNEFQNLAEGETTTVSFSYHVQETSTGKEFLSTEDLDGNQNVVNPSTVTITISGTNNGITINETSSDTTAAFTEDTDTNDVTAQVFQGETTGANLEDAWTFDFSGGDLSIAMNAIAPNEFNPYLRIYDDQGSILKTNDDGGDGYSSLMSINLEAGTYTIGALGTLNEVGSYELTFYQEVTNMNIPTGGSEIANSTVEELSATGDISFTDLDINDSHEVSVSNTTSNKGMLTASVTQTNDADTTGLVTWEYKVANAFMNHLGEGEEAQEVFSVSIQDTDALGNPVGIAVSQEVTVSITGTNDAPEIQSYASSVAGEVVEDSYQSTFTGDNTSTGSIDEWEFTHSGGDLTITMNSQTFDTYLLLFGEDMNASYTNSIAENDDGATETNASITMTNLAAGNYIVVANGHSMATGDYDLIFSKPITMTATPSVDASETTVISDLSASGDIVFKEIDLTDIHDISIVETPAEALSNLGELTYSFTQSGDGLGTEIIHWDYSVVNSAVQGLLEDKVETFTIRVEDRDANGDLTGTFAEQVVSVTISGTNNGITINETSSDTTAAFTEDTDTNDVTAQVFQGETTGANLEDAWTFDFSGGDLSIAMNAIAPNEFNPYLRIYDDQGSILKTNDDGGDGYSSLMSINLEAGTYTIGALGTLNEVGSYELTFYQEVTNMNIPTGGSEIANSTVEELSATGDISFTDLDINDSHEVSVSNTTSNKGMLTASVTQTNDADTTGLVTWEYKVANAFMNHLGEGEEAQEVFSVSIQDTDALGNPVGIAVSQEVTVSITGTNDAPEIQSYASSVAGEVVEDSYQSTFTGDNTSTGSIDEWEFTHSGGDLTITMNSQTFDTYLLLFGEDMNASYTNSIAENDDGATETNASITMTNLAAGNYIVVANGHSMATGDYDLIFSKPITMTATPSVDASETTVISDLSASGDIVFKEIDLTDIHDISIVETPAEALSNLGELTYSFTQSGDGLGTEIIHWDYSVVNSAVQGLLEDKVETFTIRVEDRDANGDLTGTFAEQVVSVTISGTNNEPIINVTDASITLSNQVTEAGETLVINKVLLLEDASDVDGDDLSVFSVSLSNPFSGSVNIDSEGNISFEAGERFTGLTTVTYTVHDGALNSNPMTFDINVVPLGGLAVDATIEGLQYNNIWNGSAYSNDNLTDVNGSFTYLLGDTVEFKIGGLTIGSTVMDAERTDNYLFVQDFLDLPRTDFSAPVLTIARFLQSIDSNSDTDVITIDSIVITRLAGLTENLADADTARLLELVQIALDDPSIVESDLVTEGEAMLHLGNTITDISTNVAVAPGAVDVVLLDFPEDGSITMTQAQLLKNSDDLNGTETMSILNVTIVNGDGSIVNNGDSTWTFTPTQDWNGNVSLNFTVTDNTGLTDIASATFTVNAINTGPIAVEVTEEIVLESSLVDTPSEDYLYTVDPGDAKSLENYVTDPDLGDTLTFDRSGTNVSLTLKSENTEFLTAIKTGDLAYIQNFVTTFAMIPEVVTALANNVDGIPTLDVAQMLEGIATAADGITALGIFATGMQTLGITLSPIVNPLDSGFDPIAVAAMTSLTMTIPDASSLELEGLLTINVDSDGGYSIASPLFDPLNDQESATVSFDYIASDGTLDSAPASVTLTVNGEDDEVIVSNTGPIAVEVTEEIVLESSLVDTPSEDYLYTVDPGDAKSLENYVTDPDLGDTLTFDRSGTNVSLTLKSENTEFLTAIKTGDLAYIQNFVTTFAMIPEVVTALANNVDGIPTLDVAQMLEGIATAADGITALGIFATGMQTLGITLSPIVNPLDSGFDPIAVAAMTSLTMTIPDASSLELEGLLTINVDSDGGYSIASPLFDPLNDQESATVSFDYIASDGTLDSAPASVTLTVNGEDDEIVPPTNVDPIVDFEIPGELLIFDLDGGDIDLSTAILLASPTSPESIDSISLLGETELSISIDDVIDFGINNELVITSLDNTNDTVHLDGFNATPHTANPSAEGQFTTYTATNAGGESVLVSIEDTITVD